MDLLKNVEFKENISKKMLEVALLNAIKYKGKANPGTVISGTLGFFPELKSDMKKLAMNSNKLVKEINNLTIEDQTDILLKINPKALEKEEKSIFDFLNISKEEKVTTAFPPGPEKYPHIGHAKALLLNYELAKKYGGKFILRFEDTNPGLVKEEFYKIMQEDFKWLNVKWDELVYASDYMELYYEKIRELLKKGLAYVSKSSSEEFREYKEKKITPKEYEQTPKENLELFEKMKEMQEGEAAVRLKIDINHKNSAMQDPIMFRIIKKEHARQKNKYSVWPTYDFQNSVMDGHFKITHRLRSKEFELRNELHRYIQRTLGYNETKIYEFARFNLKGVESSGRVIREKIQSKELTGWDDPRLTTLKALKRRGFLPEAIKEFVMGTGITKNEATLTWDDLIVQNKKLLEKNANRYFFVKDPVKIHLINAKKTVKLNLHPEHKKGGREIILNDHVFISKEDFENLKENKIYRLIEAFNVTYKEGKFVFLDENVNTFKQKGEAMLHYLTKETSIEASILLTDNTIINGLVEKPALDCGEVLQFERMFFAIKDTKSKDTFVFTHK